MFDKDFDSAIAEFENALILTPGNPKALKARDLASYEKTIDGIKRRTQQAIDKLDAGDLEGSLEEYQKILTLFPNDRNQQPE